MKMKNMNDINLEEVSEGESRSEPEEELQKKEKRQVLLPNKLEKDKASRFD